MRKFLVAILMMVVVLTVLGCQESTMTLTDLDGNEVTLEGTPKRIVSTAPSNTKILLSLGLIDQVVGISKYDDDYEGLPEDAIKIDFRNPDSEAILALDPDIIIASGHNKTGDEDPFYLLKEAGIPVVYLPSAASIDEIYEDISFIAKVTRTEDQGKKVIDQMKSDIEEIKALASQVEVAKKVYLEIAPAPNIYTTGSGTFQHELITTIGAENIFADSQGWFSPSPEQVIVKNPEVIITNVSYIEDPVGELLIREGFEVIQAVQEGQVFKIDGSLTSQPAPTVVEALWEMGRIVYPELFNKK